MILLLLCFAAGFGAAAFVAWIGHVSFAPVKFLPFALLAFVFTFSTANFFLHEGKIEVAAGAFSLLSLAGGISGTGLFIPLNAAFSKKKQGVKKKHLTPGSFYCMIH